MSDLLWEGLKEGCGTCAFSANSHEYRRADGETIRVVICRRYPPTVFQAIERDTMGSPSYEIRQDRPSMNEADWCGEYKRKPA